MGEIRVLIADDQPLVRQGLRATLETADEIDVVGEAHDGANAVDLTRTLRPDVVLMDISMPRMNGLDATRVICSPDGPPGTKVVILTMFGQDEHVFAALRAGASGFVVKDAPTEQVVQAVRTVVDGGALLSPSVTRLLVSEFARRPMVSPTTASRMADLTGREKDVFRLLVRGHSNEEMARAMSLGESTVKSHVQSLYQKLGVRDRVQLVIFSYENGLLQPGGGLDSAERRS